MTNIAPIAVLVVEDETLIRMNIALHLEDQGFTVFEAANADEALRLLNDNPDIQVLFTDIDMPGSMDGLKLAAAVRDRWPPIRIVVTSGHRSPAESDMPVGTPFFTKPYDADQLTSAFRKLGTP